MLQPSSATTGSASARTVIDREDAAEDPDDGSQQRSDRAGSGRPADQDADPDAHGEHGQEDATGTSGAELRRSGGLHPGARISVEGPSKEATL
jgi:hypothetical protein